MDFTKVIDMLLMIVLLPTLLNLFTIFTGTSFPAQIQPLIQAFTQLLPVLLLINLFEDLFRGAGGGAFKSIFKMIEIIILLPIMLNLLSTFTGTEISGLQQITNVLMQILPIIVLVDILSSVFKR